MTRLSRVPCSKCSLTERHHSHAGGPERHAYAPVETVPSGEHRTARLDMKVPDPDGHSQRWRKAAEREGVTLAEFTRRALDARSR